MNSPARTSAAPKPTDAGVTKGDRTAADQCQGRPPATKETTATVLPAANGQTDNDGDYNYEIYYQGVSYRAKNDPEYGAGWNRVLIDGLGAA